MPVPSIAIALIGGNCPVQAEGDINGEPFYFRARGSRWSMEIGGNPVHGAAEWEYGESYGAWPDAGWMTEDEARAFIAKAAALWAAPPPATPAADVTDLAGVKTSSPKRKDFSEPERPENEPKPRGERATPTTCIEHQAGRQTLRLSFQIKVF